MRSFKSLMILGDILNPLPKSIVGINHVVEWAKRIIVPIMNEVDVNLVDFSKIGAEPFRQLDFYRLSNIQPMATAWDTITKTGEIDAQALSYISSYFNKSIFVLGFNLGSFLKGILTSMGIPYINLRPMDFTFCNDLLFGRTGNKEHLGGTLKPYSVSIGDMKVMGQVQTLSQNGLANFGKEMLLCNDSTDPMLFEWGSPVGFEPYEDELAAYSDGAPIRIVTPASVDGEDHLRFLVRRFPNARLIYGDVVSQIDDLDIGFVVCLSPATALRAELVGKQAICLPLAETSVIGTLNEDPMQMLLPAVSIFSSAFWADTADSGQHLVRPSLIPLGVFRESYKSALSTLTRVE